MQYFSKILSSANTSFPYSQGDPIPSHDPTGLWKLHRGTSSATPSVPVLIMSFSPAAQTLPIRAPPAELAKGALQRLKTLRHPDVLKFLAASDPSPDGAVMVATEPAVPLAEKLAASNGRLSADEIMWGLVTISRALGFMHQAGLVHGRVCPASVFVTPAGDWKLAGFECTMPKDSLSNMYRDLVSLLPDRYTAPEVAKGAWDVVLNGAVHAIDSWALGCLLFEVSSGNYRSADQLRDTSAIKQELLPAYQKLLSGNTQGRVPAGEIRNFPYLQQAKFVVLNTTIEDFAIKDNLEKEAFLKRLPSRMSSLPPDFCLHKILSLAIAHLEIGGGVPSFQIAIKLRECVGEDMFKQMVVDEHGLKWYGNAAPDRALRMELIAHMDKFLPHFDDKTLNGIVFPALCAAFQDAQSPAIRDAAVKAVLSIAPRLSEKNRCQVLMGHFARLQVDPEGAIRTNTTVCIGKLASSLTAAAKQKVLIPAFVRALKDPFPPARAAALAALSSTQSIHDIKELATRALPAVAPLFVDPDCDVRAQCFNLFESILPRLRAWDLETASKAKAAIPQNGPAAAGTPSGQGTASQASGNTSWGLSSLSSLTTSIMGSSSSNTEPTAGGISNSTHAQHQQAMSRPSVSIPSSLPETPTSSAWSSTTPKAATPDLPSTRDFEEFAGANDDDDADGWGDMNIDPPKKMGDPLLSLSNGPKQGLRGASSVSSINSAESEDLWSTPVTGKPSAIKQSTVGSRTRSSAKKADDDWDKLLNTAPKPRKGPPKLGASRR